MRSHLLQESQANKIQKLQEVPACNNMRFRILYPRKCKKKSQEKTTSNLLARDDGLLGSWLSSPTPTGWTAKRTDPVDPVIAVHLEERQNTGEDRIRHGGEGGSVMKWTAGGAFPQKSRVERKFEYCPNWEMSECILVSFASNQLLPGCFFLTTPTEQLLSLFRFFQKKYICSLETQVHSSAPKKLAEKDYGYTCKTIDDASKPGNGS